VPSHALTLTHSRTCASQGPYSNGTGAGHLNASVFAWATSQLPLERCADTCDESPQAARNGICEERSLGAACDRDHSCRCPPLSDGTDCLALRPCALPSGSSSQSGTNSCAYHDDGECDEPASGTGVCRTGTDYADCVTLQNGCQYAHDGECDEPGPAQWGRTGRCASGTDSDDCCPEHAHSSAGQVACTCNYNYRADARSQTCVPASGPPPTTAACRECEESAAGAARQELTASPAPMGASPAPAPRTLATAAASTLSTKEDMLLLLCAVLTVVAVVFWVRYRRGMRHLTTAVESLEAALDVVVTPSEPQPIGMLSVNVVRIKGLTTGRAFRAQVRLAVQSERVERTERRSTRVREATYNPSRSGFGVEWHEELLLPCFSADSVLMADVLECTPGEGPEDETQIVLARVSEPVQCGAAEASAQGVWHRLVAGSSELEGQIAEEAELKLKIELRGVTITDGRVQVASGQAEDFSAETGVEELADALLQGGTRRQALIQACLEQTKAIAMAAQQAAPMAERKPIFVKAESMLGDLPSQPLCVSPFWASEGGLAAASAVAGLIAEVLQTPTDTSERAAVLRAGRFCDTVATGPQLSSMYPMLSGREAESQAQTTANPVVL